VVRRTLYAHGYEAQLFRDSRQLEFQFFHYIVTRARSCDILAWGQEKTEEDAERAALEYIQELHRRAAGQGA
jgi:hypothetical protein